MILLYDISFISLILFLKTFKEDRIKERYESSTRCSLDLIYELKRKVGKMNSDASKEKLLRELAREAFNHFARRPKFESTGFYIILQHS